MPSISRTLLCRHGKLRRMCQRKNTSSLVRTGWIYAECEASRTSAEAAAAKLQAKLTFCEAEMAEARAATAESISVEQVPTRSPSRLHTFCFVFSRPLHHAPTAGKDTCLWPGVWGEGEIDGTGDCSLLVSCDLMNPASTSVCSWCCCREDRGGNHDSEGPDPNTEDHGTAPKCSRLRPQCGCRSVTGAQLCMCPTRSLTHCLKPATALPASSAMLARMMFRMVATLRSHVIGTMCQMAYPAPMLMTAAAAATAMMPGPRHLHDANGTDLQG